MSKGRLILAFLVVVLFGTWVLAQGPIERMADMWTDRGAERIVDQDSITVLNLHSTLTDSATTWGKANRDHAAAAVMSMFYVGGGGGLYEEVTFQVWVEILNFDSLGGSRLDSATHKDSCENLLLFGLTCCSTAACSNFFLDSSEDSASYFDSTQGYLVIEESIFPDGAAGTTDSFYGDWSYPMVPASSVDSVAFTDVIAATEITIKPRKPYIRIRSQVATDTDVEDTVGILVKATRRNPYFGPYGPVELQPDYLGILRVQEATVETMTVWATDNVDHQAGEFMRITYPGYGGGEYSKLVLYGRALTTTSADRCTCAAFAVVEQSVDGITWTANDSGEVKGTTVTSFIKEVTLTDKPLMRIRSQIIDSTDKSTGCALELTAYRVK